MTRIVTLGDSITMGMGDPAPDGGWRGWAQHLASGLPDPELHNLAALGAQATHVERDQLPAALGLRPDIASVVVGINDTLRAGFDPARTGRAAARTVAALRADGVTVLTMRLPDPGRMFGDITFGARFGTDHIEGAYSVTGIVDSVQVSVVPEPASLALFGLGGLALLNRPSRRSA